MHEAFLKASSDASRTRENMEHFPQNKTVPIVLERGREYLKASGRHFEHLL